jgi:hypothetical protein
LPCSNCTKNLPIVNVKYNLCNNCNSIRIAGKSQSERQAESALKYRKNALERYRAKITEEVEDYTLKGIIKPVISKSIPYRVQNKKPVRHKPLKKL